MKAEHNRTFNDIRVSIRSNLGVNQELRRYLLKGTATRRALDNLRLTERQIDSVLQMVDAYCSPNFARSFFKEELATFKKDTKKLIATVELLEEVFADVERSGKTLILADTSLRASLSKYRKSLEQLLKEFTKAASLKGKERDDYHLVSLVNLLKETTGEPHFGDLAYLIEAGLMFYDMEEEEDVTSASIAVRYKRYIKAYPTLKYPNDLLRLYPDLKIAR